MGGGASLCLVPLCQDLVITDALGILLTAERTAILSGRDDEFVAVVLTGYTGMRWGEVVRLETEFARPISIRVEWQSYELDTGELVRRPPKDDSYRTIDAMDRLSALVADHVARTNTLGHRCCTPLARLATGRPPGGA